MNMKTLLRYIALLAIVSGPSQIAMAQEADPPEVPAPSDAPAPPEATSPPEEVPLLVTPPAEVTPEKPLPSFGGPSKEASAAQDMIDEALKKIDEKVERDGNVWTLNLGAREILIVTDPNAERMRIVIPIGDANKLEEGDLIRLMQANFDSALDARYAIARGVLWGTFIHPLNSLTEEDFLSGLLQSISIVRTYGSTYSSGSAVFGGGDSQEQIKEETPETDPTTVT